MTENEKILEQREKYLASELQKLEQRQNALEEREKSLNFRSKLLFVFFLLELAVFAVILYMGQPLFSKKIEYDKNKIQKYVHMSTTSEQQDLDKQTKELLASIEGDRSLGQFVRNEAFEAIDFTANESEVSSAYLGMRIFPVKNETILANPEQIVEKIMMIAKDNTFEITKDRKQFRFDLTDNGVWDIDIIRKSCISWNELKPGRGKYTYDNAKNHLSGILRNAEEKQSNHYGYVRFFFKTSIEGVYIMRAYSLDVARPPKDYFVLEPFTKYKAAENLTEKVELQRKYDGEFRTLSFSFIRDTPLYVADNLNTCLNEFFSQLLNESE